MKLSLISPSRNNKKYLEWSYNSVRKHCDSSVEYCVADDFSDDGTLQWCRGISKVDGNFKFIRNDGPRRLGHTILYDRLIKEVATGDVVMIWHSDMFASPNMDKRILEEIDKNKVISLTRIEPPLHPPGPEKIIQNFGVEPENFNEKEFLSFIKKQKINEHTDSMFAPWAILKKDFLSIGGHDPLFAPQSREDSDIFNRFILNGYTPIQLRDTFVYHLTCRGSRFNPRLTTLGNASNEWVKQNFRSERNFIRKWGHMIRVDKNLKPIIPHKYKIAFHTTNCNFSWLYQLEPWASYIFIEDANLVQQYIDTEQANTLYDLSKRVLPKKFLNSEYDILVEFDCLELTPSNFNFIVYLSDIISKTNEIGIFNYDIFKINIHSLSTYEKTLINIGDEYGRIEQFTNIDYFS